MGIQRREKCFPAHLFVSKTPFGIEVYFFQYGRNISSCRNLILMGVIYSLASWDFMRSLEWNAFSYNYP